MTACGSCTVDVHHDVEETTRRMINGLDDERRGRLSEAYNGEPPEVLCAECMLAVVGVINGVQSDTEDEGVR